MWTSLGGHPCKSPKTAIGNNNYFKERITTTIGLILMIPKIVVSNRRIGEYLHIANGWVEAGIVIKKYATQP